MNYYLIIDAGTGSGRAIVFDGNGRQISVAQREWTHQNFSGVDGAIDFDTAVNWKIISDLIKLALSQAGITGKQIRAISTTSMCEAMVLYDKSGSEIWSCSNVDARSTGEAIWLRNNISEEDFYKKTGQTFSISDVPRILWVKNHLPGIFEQVYTFGMINDWIVQKLTGEFIAEPTNASTSGLFNIYERDWEDEYINLLGLDRTAFPKVLEPGTVVGPVQRKIAEEFGFSPDTIVVTGGGDAQLGTVGVGSVSEGNAVVIGGTFWQQEVNTTRPVPHPNCSVRINAHPAPGMWQYEGISFQLGLIMRWFRDGFCHRESKFAKELGISPYTILAEMGATIPLGSNRIIPISSDIMNYLHWKHAGPSLLDFNINEPELNGKAAVFKALMENASFNTLGNLKLIETATGNFPSEVTFSGGASNSCVWSGILADVLGIPVKVPVVKESTALGAFICAAVGAGHFKSFKEATTEICQIETIHLPRADNHKYYQDEFARWRKIYNDMLVMSDRGLLQHMWKAPGE